MYCYRIVSVYDLCEAASASGWDVECRGTIAVYDFLFELVEEMFRGKVACAVVYRHG